MSVTLLWWMQEEDIIRKNCFINSQGPWSGAVCAAHLGRLLLSLFFSFSGSVCVCSFRLYLRLLKAAFVFILKEALYMH